MSDHDHVMIDQRLEDAMSAGCAESRILLTRRAMLGVSAGLFSWACLPRHAEAFEDDRRLLIVTLVGGMDGLHVAFESSEVNVLSGYRASMLANRGDYLGSYARLGSTGFVINSKLKNFKTMFDKGEAALVHAIAPPLRSRSHFDCMDNLQNGQPSLGNSTKDGWLNRFLAGLRDSEPASRALASGGAPLILQGQAPVQSWSNSLITGLGVGYAENIHATYAASSNPLFQRLATELASGIATHRAAMTANTAPTTGQTAPAPAPAQTGMMAQPAAEDSNLTKSLRGTARLMKAASGPRIAVLSVGGLDTHSGQVSMLDSCLEQLDTSLDAFKTELGDPIWAKTVVVCVTEFGRSARNNLEGTDHGTGTVALLLGGNVKGGRVIANWPGLTDLQDNRDLKATIDIRGLFKGILRDHLGAWRNERFLNNIVFPGSRHIRPFDGLMRSAPPPRLQFKV